MKALIHKDLAALWKYCRTYFYLCGAFLAAAVFLPEYDFLTLYPCFFMGMLPTTLIAYDERDRWERFSLTLPITRRQLVSAKYLVGLILQGGVFSLTAAAVALQGVLRGTFFWEDYLMELVLLLCLGLAAPALMLPFVFKLGSERGRLGYVIGMGVSLGVCVFTALTLDRLGLGFSGSAAQIALVILAAVVLLYPVSWFFSVRWYEKREF